MGKKIIYIFKIKKCVYLNLCSVHIQRYFPLPFLNQWKEVNDRRKYFTIIIHESMGPGRDQRISSDKASNLPKQDIRFIFLK